MTTCHDDTQPDNAEYYRCDHCREPITGDMVRLFRLDRLGEPMPAWHWDQDRPCCRAAAGTVRAERNTR
ncbi:hypothetical protein [Streptomyces sp. NPDC053048]|uniref:hypothetical protein n=1 Tax=Streptomyces sp. NPDC053048 TaxID=3365694 RepID=UPI0037D1B8C0